MNVCVEDIVGIASASRTAVAVCNFGDTSLDYIRKNNKFYKDVFEQYKDKKVFLLKPEPNYEDNGIVCQEEPTRLVLVVV